MPLTRAVSFDYCGFPLGRKIKIVAINFPYSYQFLDIYLDSSRGLVTGHWYI